MGSNIAAAIIAAVVVIALLLAASVRVVKQYERGVHSDSVG